MHIRNKCLGVFLLIILAAAFSSSVFASGEPQKRGKLVFFTPIPIEGLTPEEVMEKAAVYEDEKKFSQALEILKNYLKKNPEDKYAPEMSFRMAQIHFKTKNYGKAYEIIKVVLDKYANISNPDRVLEKCFEIANIFYDGKKRKVLGIPLANQYRKAIEIYEKIIGHAPFGQFADKSQFQIGKTYMLLDEKPEAIEAFTSLCKDYPESPHVEEALYLIGLNYEKMSKKPDYDQTHTEKAIESYRKFLKSNPESTYYEEANSRLNSLLSRKGKEIFKVAVFYYDRNKFQSAKIYFDVLIKEYAMTEWAQKSTKYLSLIELAEDKNEKNPS